MTLRAPRPFSRSARCSCCTANALTDEIQISAVVTSRNDGHGGGLLRRMQAFVDGFVAQCRRHGLRAELLIVEWNPPADAAPLAAALRWPAERAPCDIRIVTVPPELHRKFAHSDKMRLFQMIAKNVGVRRARGRYVLATNVDILFSDAAVRFMRDRMRPGTMYLADRADVPAEVPEEADFDRVLAFCERETFRINTGALVLNRPAAGWALRDRVKASVATPVGYAIYALENRAGYIRREGLRRSLLRFRLPFTNSCGDFTAMSREDWLRLRGYPEWPVFSYHLDSIIVYQAAGCGMRVRRLGPRARVFHIDHSGGYTRETAAAMFERLKASGTPFIGDQELTRIVYGDIRIHRGTPEPVTFNPPDWGLHEIYLRETNP